MKSFCLLGVCTPGHHIGCSAGRRVQSACGPSIHAVHTGKAYRLLK